MSMNSFRPTLKSNVSGHVDEEAKTKMQPVSCESNVPSTTQAHLRTIKLAMDDRWDEALDRNVNGNAD